MDGIFRKQSKPGRSQTGRSQIGRSQIGRSQIRWSQYEMTKSGRSFTIESFKIKLQEIYGKEEYSNWLKLLSLHSVKDNTLIFNAATKFMCDWINSHYGKKILKNSQNVKMWWQN